MNNNDDLNSSEWWAGAFQDFFGNQNNRPTNYTGTDGYNPYQYQQPSLTRNNNYNTYPSGTYYSPNGNCNENLVWNNNTRNTQSEWIMSRSSMGNSLFRNECTNDAYNPMIQYIRQPSMSISEIKNDIMYCQNPRYEMNNPYYNRNRGNVLYNAQGIPTETIVRNNRPFPRQKMYGKDYKEVQEKILVEMMEEAKDEFYRVCDSNMFAFMGRIPIPIYQKYRPRLLQLEVEAEERSNDFISRLFKGATGKGLILEDQEDKVIKTSQSMIDRMQAINRFEQEERNRKMMMDSQLRYEESQRRKLESYYTQVECMFHRDNESTEEFFNAERRIHNHIEADKFNYRIARGDIWNTSYKEDQRIEDARMNWAYRFAVNRRGLNPDPDKFEWIYKALHKYKSYKEFVQGTGIVDTKSIPVDYFMGLGLHGRKRLEEEFDGDIVKAYYSKYETIPKTELVDKEYKFDFNDIYEDIDPSIEQTKNNLLREVMQNGKKSKSN